MREHWNPESHWEDHSDWPVDGWIYEVDEGDTRLGYVDWVNDKIEQEKAA